MKNNEDTTSQNIWDTVKAVIRGIYNNTILHQETRNYPNNLISHLRNQRTEKPKSQQKEGNNQNWSKINEIAMKKTIEKINKTKNWFFEKMNKTSNPLVRFSKKEEKCI